MTRALLAFALLAPLATADWTTGVGGNAARDGLSPETGPAGASLLWRTGIPAQVAQQAVIEGNVVVTARIMSLSDVINGTLLVAQDLRTGQQLWSTSLPVNFPDAWRNRVTAIRDGVVYATRSGNTNAEYLYALSAANGAIVWRSQARISETSTESLSFAANGDPITTGQGAVIRIDKTNGNTLWSIPRACPMSDGCNTAVFGNRGYFSETGPPGSVLTAVDVDLGMRLYSTAVLAGGSQIGPFVGPDGSVYVARANNQPGLDFLVAFSDTGSALVERWRSPIGYVPFASFGVGPDGSVYSYTPNREVVRLSAANGMVLNVSTPILSDFPPQPRMAIDALGRVFVTNGGFGGGGLWSFNADLTPRWNVAIPNVNLGGPAIGRRGILVVCGVGTNVAAYYPPDQFALLSTMDTPRPGATVNLQVRADGDAGNGYLAACSLGSTPGLPIGNRTLPLNADLLFVLSLSTPSIFEGFQGVLDGMGLGTARIHVPPVQGLVGITIYAAFVSLRPGAPSGVGVISDALALTFAP
jgi:outer membrane protein assembly factor BamB